MGEERIMSNIGLNKSGEYRSKVIALLLWFFLGGFGIHNFYLGRNGIAITQLVLTIVGVATSWLLIGFIPLAVVGVWWFVDLIMIVLAPDDETFGWSMS